MKNTTFGNSRWLSTNTPNIALDEWNGYPEILGFLELKKFLNDVFSFELIFYIRASLGAPD